MEEIFGTDWNHLFGTSNATACAKCGAGFALFFPQKDDPDNRSYARSIEVKIAEDCKEGKHSQEIVLTATP